MKTLNTTTRKTNQEICKDKPFWWRIWKKFFFKATRNDKTHHEICRGKSFLLEDLEWFFFGTFFFYEEQKEKLKEMGFLMGTYINKYPSAQIVVQSWAPNKYYPNAQYVVQLLSIQQILKCTKWYGNCWPPNKFPNVVEKLSTPMHKILLLWRKGCMHHIDILHTQTQTKLHTLKTREGWQWIEVLWILLLLKLLLH